MLLFGCPSYFNLAWAIDPDLIDTAGATLDANSFRVAAGHPRVYINPSRVDVIRAASTRTTHLNNTDFPQIAGRLMFDVKPAPGSDTQQVNAIIFDKYDRRRNHIFIRHIDQVNPQTGLTACGSNSGDKDSLCMQVALQSGDSDHYIAAMNFLLSANHWHTLDISWNPRLHTAMLKVDNFSPSTLQWGKDGRGMPLEWRPDQQHFVFAGRDGIDNIRLYDGVKRDSARLLVDYPMNDAMGATVSDATGHAYHALISPGVTWNDRSEDDSNTAIYMDGKGGSLRVAPANVLAEAWPQLYGNALALATRLSRGESPVDAKQGHPEIASILGLAYLVTGDRTFSKAALAYADRLLAVQPRDAGGDYAQAFRIEAMGILYDWLFPEMGTKNSASGRTYGEDLATAIMETIRYQGAFICGSGNSLTTNWTCRSRPPKPDALGGHSFENNTRISAAALAIVDEHPELRNLLVTEYSNFVSLYNPLRAWLSVDGGSHMGWGYGTVYSSLDPVQLWDTAVTGVPSMQAPWQGKLIDRYIYGLRGNLSFPTSGDTVIKSLHDDTITAFALLASNHFGNRSAQDFYNRWILPSATGDRLAELLYWKPGMPASPLEKLDYSRWFRNAGQVLMRDTWDYTEATLLEFKSTSFWSQNHHHLDQNAFTLFYKAPLLVDSGAYDGYKTSHWSNYYTRTIAHNTITVMDPSEKFGTGNQYGTSNDGGQKIMRILRPTLEQIQDGGSNHIGGVTHYEYTPDYTYVVGNASKAYSDSKLDQVNGFLRSIVFLRNPSFWRHPVIVVFDQVNAQTGKGDLVKRFLLHCVNEPEPVGGNKIGPGQYRMAGDTIKIRNGAGMLFAQTLLPENPVLTKIGGEDASGDHRFLVESLDYRGSYQLQNFPPSLKPGKGNDEMGAWRVEITAPVPARQEYFLHVLSVADNGMVPAPASAQNLSSDNAAVALLGVTQIIAFSKSKTAADQLSWDMPVAHARIFIAGLLPDTLFSGNIEKDGSGAAPYHFNIVKDKAGKFRSSPQGTLTIQ